ncbi:MAG: hypothetical protein ACK50L_04480 [Bacteroidota bacterium]
MAVSVLNSTAVPCISFSAIGQVSATNPPQTQNCKTLYAIIGGHQQAISKTRKIRSNI